MRYAHRCRVDQSLRRIPTDHGGAGLRSAVSNLIWKRNTTTYKRSFDPTISISALTTALPSGTCTMIQNQKTCQHNLRFNDKLFRTALESYQRGHRAYHGVQRGNGLSRGGRRLAAEAVPAGRLHLLRGFQQGVFQRRHELALSHPLRQLRVAVKRAVCVRRGTSTNLFLPQKAHSFSGTSSLVGTSRASCCSAGSAVAAVACAAFREAW